ncbi:MAG: hypothetical protein QOJ79_2146 [Actinomycetota bacterium]|jgi:hypothetical protein|nr:hypothetical protein [Actinomycetota bacterium]
MLLDAGRRHPQVCNHRRLLRVLSPIPKTAGHTAIAVRPGRVHRASFAMPAVAVNEVAGFEWLHVRAARTPGLGRRPCP